MNLEAFGIQGILEIINDPETKYYCINGDTHRREYYVYLDGLHVLIAKDLIIEECNYINIESHSVGGYYKPSTGSWVSGHWRGGSTQRRIIGYRTEQRLVDFQAFVGPLDICDRCPVAERTLKTIMNLLRT